MKKLSDFSKNTYSQWGEDGIIEKLFSVIGVQSKVCIEFGAWDGFHLSNTANLWTNGWQGILIEGDKERAQKLEDLRSRYDVIPLNYFVGTNPSKDSLEYIMNRHGIPLVTDLLSIDIDGDDYHVMASLKNLRPRVIVCEHNPTIPIHLSLVGKPGSKFGCSARALSDLGKKMGYRIVALTDTNVFLVEEQILPLLSEFETSLEFLEIRSHYNYVITDYLGRSLCIGEFPYGKKEELKHEELPIGLPNRSKTNS